MERMIADRLLTSGRTVSTRLASLPCPIIDPCLFQRRSNLCEHRDAMIAGLTGHDVLFFFIALRQGSVQASSLSQRALINPAMWVPNGGTMEEVPLSLPVF